MGRAGSCGLSAAARDADIHGSRRRRSYTTQPPRHAFHVGHKWTAYRDEAYGYGRLTLVNDTHARWDYRCNEKCRGGDAIWLANRYAASGTACGATALEPAADCGVDTAIAVDQRVAAAVGGVWGGDADAVLDAAPRPRYMLAGLAAASLLYYIVLF